MKEEKLPINNAQVHSPDRHLDCIHESFRQEIISKRSTALKAKSFFLAKEQCSFDYSYCFYGLKYFSNLHLESETSHQKEKVG